MNLLNTGSNPGSTTRARGWLGALLACALIALSSCAESGAFTTTVPPNVVPALPTVTQFTTLTAQPSSAPTGAPTLQATNRPADAPTIPPPTATLPPTPAQAPSATATRNFSTPPASILLTPFPTPTTGPTATPLPTFAVPAGFPSETPAPDYLSWARPGPYRSPYQQTFDIESFSSAQKLVTTYFFYWFDFAGRAGGGQNRPGANPYHPLNESSITFMDSAWYETQFSDMLDAGIDFVLPDYWGEPGQYDRRVAPAPVLNYFSTLGIPPMLEALDRLRARGKNLKIGLFLDTTIMNNEDLTSRRGKQIFYASIRDFYARIPPRHWAAVDGKPIVWLYDTQRVGNFDQSTFDYVYEHFAKDFDGMRPYIVREWQWYQARGASNEIIKTEGLYGWGAAPSGFNVDTRFTVAEVGPGFSNTQFGGQGRLFTDRQGGKYYEDNLLMALRSRHNILAVETWNELGEASGILETVEFGRQYIDMTRRYADLFKAGKIP